MEHLQELLLNAVKLEELELQLPELKKRYNELKEIVSDRKYELDWAVLTAKNLDNPSFFQRLLGRVAEKQEKAQSEARQAAATYEAVKRELDELEHQLDTLQETYAARSDSREAYKQARTTFLASADPQGTACGPGMDEEGYPAPFRCSGNTKNGISGPCG